MPKHIGGNFAPPLTDELLRQYGELIAAVPAKTPLRDALDTLLACVLAWWNVPESAAKKRPHPVGRGSIQPLDQATIDALWDRTPYPEELTALEPLLEEIDAAASRRNGELLGQWREEISRRLFADHFPAGLSQATLALYYRTHKALARLSPTLAAGVRLLFPDVPSDVDARWDAWQAAVKAALGSPSPPIRRPELPPTPLRDAAMHLLWHAKELAADREPFTADKL
jgi:hypothetical protein